MKFDRKKYISFNFSIQLVFYYWLLLSTTTITISEETIAQDHSYNDNSLIIFVSGFVAQPTIHFGGVDNGVGVRVFQSTSIIDKLNAMYPTSRRATNPRQVKKKFRSSSDDEETHTNEPPNSSLRLIRNSPMRSILFSIVMSSCGAVLGPFLDSYHSAFGVLKYDEPIRLTLWGSKTYPALTTTFWVPELFGLAGFLIGWLYILLDDSFLVSSDERRRPSPPKILFGISLFTSQYWLSGIFVQMDVLDRSGILNVMSILATVGFLILDGTFSGLLVSFATCLGGPLIEAGLITATTKGILSSGYHYTDCGETGFFPLWIVPVYFLGGPANGNLARGFWNALSADEEDTITKKEADKKSCDDCLGTRRIECPNCDGLGTYTAMGNRSVKCTSCNARGFVMCRSCFNLYDEDPYDIDSIREIMNRMPD
mmetsp:Transcript_15794/g.36568  ORF Transcript_15794/g.36568 Transcript_15794/m.36568 type:complete len:426 (-) Transcript_15794:150-1427(-)